MKKIDKEKALAGALEKLREGIKEVDAANLKIREGQLEADRALTKIELAEHLIKQISKDK